MKTRSKNSKKPPALKQLETALKFIGVPPKKKSWVNAVKTVVDGINFPSKLEASVYNTLKVMEKAGEISNIRTQVTIPLIGKLKWKADFVVFNEKLQVDQVHEAKSGWMDQRFRTILQVWPGAGPYTLHLWQGSYMRPSITKTIKGKE
jgi:hypothetical protein